MSSPSPRTRRTRRLLAAAGVALLSLGAVGGIAAGPAGANPPPAPPWAAGGFTPYGPHRILDTRVGTGGVPVAKVGPGQTIVLHADPAYLPHATAVALNVTVVNPSQATHLTVWPAAEPKPATSSLNVRAGETRANQVTVKLDPGDDIALSNNSGTVDIVADSLGFYDDGNVGGARFVPAPVPVRKVDTRDGTGGVPKAKLGPGQTLEYHARGNVLPGNTSTKAVAINVTAANGTGPSHLTVYPGDQPKPLASTVNFSTEATPNLTIAQVGDADGVVKIYNNAGWVDVILDEVGLFTVDFISPLRGHSFVPVTPSRIYDSRQFHLPGAPGHIGPKVTDVIEVAGLGGVPTKGVEAVVLNLTAVDPTQATHLLVYPADPQAKVPGVSFLNAVANQTVANAVIVPVTASGHELAFNNSGNTDVVADVVGYIESPQKLP